MARDSRTKPGPCPCQDGMFAPASIGRRLLFGAGASAAALAPLQTAAGALPPGALPAAPPSAPPDPRLVPGRATGQDGGYGSRSPFETARRVPGPVPNDLTTWTFTPLASQIGNITPSGPALRTPP